MAATTIGYVAPGDPPAGEGAVVAFSPSPAYTVPYPGVITSWTVNGGAGLPETSPHIMALKLFRTTVDPLTGDLTATVVATSLQAGAGEGMQTRIARIPVTGGEQLGVRFPEPGPLFPSGSEASACSSRDMGSVGAVYTKGQTLTCESGRAVDISATIEPDGDGDGFGDETQDRCPDLAGSATGCPSRYRGRGGGFPFELRFGTRNSEGLQREKPVTVLEAEKYGVKLRCGDGYRTTYTLSGDFRKSPISVKSDGPLDYTLGIAQGNGILGGRTRIAGRLEGAKAHGTVTGTVRLRHHGACAVHRFSWRIRSG